MEFQHELIIPNEGLPFKIFLFEGSRGNYIREKHWHTSIEIFAVMEGELLFYINHEKYPLHAGELLIVNANEIHSVHALKTNKTAVIQIPLGSLKGILQPSSLSGLRAVCAVERTAAIRQTGG